MLTIPHLETNCTAACQNRCISCNHFVPMDVPNVKASMARPEQMERDLRLLGRVLHADAYGMLGGEPTLHPQLVDLLNVARASQIADRVEVWTNGQRLRQMGDDFWTAFDVLVVSAYPGKLADDDLAWIAAKSAEAGVRLEVKDERRYPNFTQLLEAAPTGPLATQSKYRACWFKGYSRVVDDGFFFRCCTSPYIPRLLQGRPFGADGLAVDEGLTEAKVAAFLGQPYAMESCKICAGRNTPSAVPVAWREIDDPAEWLAASSGRRP